MPDSITTIATALPAAAGAAATIFGVVKPFLTKILGPAADEIGELGRDYIKDFRARNVATRLANADKLLNDAGIEPQPIAPKVLVPLLESASLEDGPMLGELWDGLLANAANPHARAKIDGNLVDILKQLNYNQSIILLVISAMLGKGSDQDSIARKVTVILHSQRVLDNLRTIHEDEPETMAAINEEEFYVNLDNLARLRLCTLTGIDPLNVGLVKEGKPKEALINMQMFHSPGRANLSITYLGLAFLAATEAPASPNLSDVS